MGAALGSTGWAVPEGPVWRRALVWGGADFPRILPADMDSPQQHPGRKETHPPTPEAFRESMQGWEVPRSPALLQALPVGTGHRSC